MDDDTEVKTIRVEQKTNISLMGMENQQHDITSFLERPVKVGTYDVSTSMTRSSNIVAYNLTKLLGNANNYGKIFGFRYFRGSVELSVYINTQPFQAGGLLMYYIPYEANSDIWSQKSTLTGKTGFLSEVLNFEDSGPGRLEIPFNHPHGFLDIVNLVGDMGTFFLDIYSPLITHAASSTAEVTVYARFTDISLFGPTDEPPSHPHIPQPGPPKLFGQVGKTESESKQEAGIITKISGFIAKNAKHLSGVPVIGAFVQPISWVATAVNKVAEFFGWSKPISVATQLIVKSAPCRFMNNYNGLDTSNNLGLDADNQLASYQFFGHSDQLAIDNIVSDLNYVGNFSWSTAALKDRQLIQIDVHPDYGRKFTETSWVTTAKNKNRHAKLVTGVSFLGFVSTFFRLWRGDIRYQFRCFKTRFHSGRLLITWRPGDTQEPRNLDTPMTYAVVWDLSKNNTVSFIVPYMNPRPWLFTQRIRDFVKGDKTPQTDNGHLVVSVLNKLVASSDAVGDSIDIIVEICGEKGFSFAHPVDTQLIPVTAATHYPKSNNSSDDVVDEPFLLIGEIGDPVETVDLVPKGMVSQPIEPEKMAIGEKVSSLRQLMKRFSSFPLNGTVYKSSYPQELEMLRNSHVYEIPKYLNYYASDVAILDHQTFKYGPVQSTLVASSAAPIPKIEVPRKCDLLTRISSIFAYWRGGVRIKAINGFPLTDDKHLAVIKVQYKDNGKDGVDKNLVINPDEFQSTVGAIQLSNLDVEGVGEYQFPFYSNVVYRSTRVDIGPIDRVFSTFAVANPKGSTQTVFEFWRAGSDDLDFIFKVGVPTFQYIDSSADHPN